MTRTFPFPLPNGWFQLGYSDELVPEAALSLRYFGADLVLSRAPSGVAEVITRGDDEPRRWPVVERAGIIWVWRHAESAAPAWALPEIRETETGEWGAFRRFRWTIRTRNQEMGENAVDSAHFRYVHGTTEVPDCEVSIDGVIRRALQRVSLKTPRGVASGTIESHAFGLGCSITRFRGICETLLIGSSTPIDDDHVDTRFSFLQKSANGVDPERGVGAAVIRDIVKQMAEDIPIWENKIYLARPLLCDGDGPIMQYRRWASQFYSARGLS